MGCPDSVFVPCPKCGTESEFQSKGAEVPGCNSYKLADCPPDVLSDVNRHAPNKCEKCGTWFEVSYKLEMKVSDVRVVEVKEPPQDYWKLVT